MPRNNRKIRTWFLVAAILIIAITSAIFIIPSKPKRSAASSLTIENSYKNYPFQHRGQLHFHTKNSDGKLEANDIVKIYRDYGYKFYAITDHNVMTGEASVPGILNLGWAEEKGPLPQNHYARHLGVIFPQKMDGKFKLQKVTMRFYKNKIVWAAPDPLTKSVAILGNNYNSIIQSRINAVTSKGGIVIVNHPFLNNNNAEADVSPAWTTSDLIKINNLFGIEVFGSGTASSWWDPIISADKRVWAIATDDAHKAEDIDKRYIVINSQSKNPDRTEIWKQLKEGNFYAASKVNGTRFDISDFSVSGRRVHASTTAGSKIRWIRSDGAIIKTSSGKSDYYDIVGGEKEKYVRVEILDDNNSTRAWSQPIFISGSYTPPDETTPALNVPASWIFF